MNPPRAGQTASPLVAPMVMNHWLKQGQSHWQQGQLAQAADCARMALKQGAPPLDAYALLGDSLLGLQQFEAAFDAFANALVLDPDSVYLRFLCGETLFHLGRFQDVVAYLADLQPGDNLRLAVEHALTLGRAQQHLGLTEQAELNLLKAYMLQPENEETIRNLATLYEEDGRHAIALQFLEPASLRHPESIRLHYNLASNLAQCGHTARSIGVLEHVLKLAPHHIQAHQNLSLALLLTGDLESGWEHYAWRFNRHAAESGSPGWIPRTPLLPEDLTGRTVRVCGEQGIGDELFFMRFLPALRARGARVLYRPCNSKLVPLLSNLVESRLLDAIDIGNLEADISLWAADLPFSLGGSHAGDHPPPIALQVDTAKKDAWKVRFPQLNGKRPQLGIAWRAGTTGSQSGQHRWLSKCLPLAALMDALAPLPVDLVVLQRHPHPEELDYIEQRVGADRLLDASKNDSDLVDLLALLSILDGLVGVSNTNVHLAAGLGKALHTLVPSPYEFRWGMQASTPWFPGAYVYRQDISGDWDAPLRQLQARLRTAVTGG